MTLTLVRDSWMPELSRSSFFCITVNLGKAVFSMRKMARVKKGITTRITSASLVFIRKAMISAPISMPGARNIILSPIMVTFCTCWMSLVSRVTRDPVLYWSIFLNEKF